MDIAESLSQLRKIIHNKELITQRPQGSVKLLAVSKKQSIEKILEAHKIGQKDFAENYVEEALPKIKLLKDYDIAWHFIGRIQTNKAKQISEHFSFVHSITRFIEAKKLNDYRPLHLPALNICLQVNVSGDENKQGLIFEEVFELANAVKKFPRLCLRGLMTILKDEKDYEKQYDWFMLLSNLFNELNQRGFNLDILSMGMSEDMQAAIAAGSTMVRIGRGIFGERS